MSVEKSTLMPETKSKFVASRLHHSEKIVFQRMLFRHHVSFWVFQPLPVRNYVSFGGRMLQESNIPENSIILIFVNLEWCYLRLLEGYNSLLETITPRKINMEPENTPLEKENHLPNHHFQGLRYVIFPGCKKSWKFCIVWVVFSCADSMIYWQGSESVPLKNGTKEITIIRFEGLWYCWWKKSCTSW